jgi:signal transduction histidine kinase
MSDPATARPTPATRFHLALAGAYLGAAAAMVALVRRHDATASGGSLRLSLALVVVLAALLAVQLALSRRLLAAPIARRLVQEVAREADAIDAQVEHRTHALLASGAELERTVREREQARSAEALARFASGIGHELNNVLTAMRGFTGLLLEELPRDDPRREEVLELQVAEDRGAAIARQLHAFARRDPGAVRVVDPSRVVAHVEAMLRPVLPPDLVLAVELAPGAGPIRADPALLEQVVVTLAAHARDAQPAGGRVAVRMEEVAVTGREVPAAPVAPGRWLVLSVSDDGPPMTTEALDYAFDPFYPVRGRDMAAGLGLAAVRAIARGCGGTATAESAGGGSTIRVWLPVVEGEANVK